MATLNGNKEMGRRRSVPLADYAAAPALFYSNWVMPFEEYKNVTAYFSRLSERPSFAQVVEEARPYRDLSPK